MAIAVIIYGKSGSGKSRSLKNFAEDEIYLVNVLGKMMPFKGTFKYITVSDNPQTIMAGLAKMPCKVAVIDDFGYIMTDMYMRGNSTGNQFDLFKNIGNTVFELVDFVIHSDALKKDQIVYITLHEEIDEYGNSKLRTIGKLLEQKVCLEGMVTVTLHAAIKNKRHVFITNSDGTDIAKSPEGMFTENEVENDLFAVDAAIRNYYGFEPLREEK